MALLILLSPSKTQELGRHHVEQTIPEHIARSEQLVDKLRQYSTSELSKLMTMSENLAKANHERFAGFSFPPTFEKCIQALLGFRGDVFSEIEADNYSGEDFRFAQKHLRILSGLYGILRPLDLIQPYRLEMGGKFQPEEGQTLYKFWNEAVTRSITQALSGLENGTILNLASAEYFKVVLRKKIQKPIVNVYFKQRNNGKLRTVAIHAKKARGALTNYIIKNRIEQVPDLVGFTYNGYEYDSSNSTTTEILYIQNQGHP